jgi:O-antigen ligase
MFFALNLMFLSPKGFSQTLPRILILSVSISASLGIVGSIFKMPFFVEGLGAPLTRSVGASTDPNNFSLMIIFILPLLAHWFFMARRMVDKVLVSLLFCMNILGIVFTYSRGGALVLSLTLFLLFIEHMRRFRPKYLGFVAVFATVALLLTVILVPSSYWERQKSVTRTAEDSALARRISYFHVGWEAFKENPLLGSGPGTFKLRYAQSDAALQFERDEEKLKRYAHNTYMEYLVGTGMLGFIVFLIILRLAWKNFSLAKKRYQLQDKGELSSLVSAFRISFFSLLTYLFIFSGVYHKYLLVALAISQTAFNLSQDSHRETDGSTSPSE